MAAHRVATDARARAHASWGRMRSTLRPCPLLRRPGQPRTPGGRAADGKPAPQHLHTVVAAAAAAASPGSAPQAPGPVAAAVEAGVAYFSRFRSIWSRFLPMVTLFFTLSFINTLLDALKDTLVVTAPGGGAHVIPFLSVYAVLPSAVAFFWLYSRATARMTRQALFNTTVAVFALFFAAFPWVHAHVGVLHPHALADVLEAAVPQGLAGAVSMVRNWTFTLFYCAAELFGDVCLGLLFWGLANDTTALDQAPMLYPLLGLGANAAQALAGVVLKGTTAMGSGGAFTQEVQACMVLVVALSGVVVALHNRISASAAAAVAPAAPPAPAASAGSSNGNGSSGQAHAGGSNGSSAPAPASSAAGNGSSSSSSSSQEAAPAEEAPVSFVDSMRTLAKSMDIRCLAVMSLAQGLCGSLSEYAFKVHLSILYPSPSDFTSFLGEVALWSGLVTCTLMVLSPIMFDRLGWRGVANFTPQLLLGGGSLFFLACMGYQWVYGAAAHAGGAAGVAAAASPAGLALLQGVVMGGALLYVFSKGAKFSLFKPAEEMVYITLDEEGRTRGKAAIDVVGAQTGKSGGSILQQVLLLLSAGAVQPILPAMFLVFVLFTRAWSGAVDALATHKNFPGPKDLAQAQAGPVVLAQEGPVVTGQEGVVLGLAESSQGAGGASGEGEELGEGGQGGADEQPVLAVPAVPAASAA